jgi:hypothetical protein
MADTTYNGWTNRQTWNVCLWIDNDEGLYDLRRSARNSYRRFVAMLREPYEGEPTKPDIYYRTPDGVAWDDSAVNVQEIDSHWEDE